MVGRLVCLSVALFTSLALGCATWPRGAPARGCRSVPVGPGPEDFALDPAPSGPRLIVATLDRTSATDTTGALLTVDLRELEVQPLERRGEPTGFLFRPHGVALVVEPDGRRFLYVVLHGPGLTRYAWHAIGVYKVGTTTATLVQLLHDPLLTSPNDLVAVAGGRIWVSNDATPELVRTALGWARQRIVVYDPPRGWRVAAEGLAFPNGLAVVGDHMYVAASLEDRIYRYRIARDGTLHDPVVVAELPIPDNLLVVDGWLYVAGHPSQLGFMRHAALPHRFPGPAAVWRIHLTDGHLEALLYDGEGTLVSASTVALAWNDRLFVGQPFRNGLYLCPLPPSRGKRGHFRAR